MCRWLLILDCRLQAAGFEEVFRLLVVSNGGNGGGGYHGAKGRRACVPTEFVDYDYDYVYEKLRIEAMRPQTLVPLQRAGEPNVGDFG